MTLTMARAEGSLSAAVLLKDCESMKGWATLTEACKPVLKECKRVCKEYATVLCEKQKLVVNEAGATFADAFSKAEVTEYIQEVMNIKTEPDFNKAATEMLLGVAPNDLLQLQGLLEKASLCIN